MGFFTVSACFVVVNRGEVMVGCVTNVARGTTLFRGFKIGQDCRIYFLSRELDGANVGCEGINSQ